MLYLHRRTHRRHVEAALDRWGEVRRGQAEAAVGRMSEQDRAGQWLAALDRRLAAESALDPALERWGKLRRHQADTAVANLGEQDRIEEWLAALDRRDGALDVGPDGEDGDDVVAQANDQARWAIKVLVRRAHDDVDTDTAQAARNALRDCVRLAAVPETAPVQRRGPDRLLDSLDEVLAKVAVWALERGWFPASWVSRRVAARLRWVLAVGVVVVAIAAAAAVGHGYYLLALPLLLAAAGLDLVEGSIGRVTGTESPVSRWAANLLSHLGELVFITGIAWDQQRLHRPLASTAVLAAGYLALYGSYVRTTARQVGTFAWSSMWERVARMSSFIAYLGLSIVGAVGVSQMASDMAVLAPLLTAAVFGGFGAWEALRVGYEVHSRPIESITTVIEDTDGRCQSYIEGTDRRPVPGLLQRAAGAE